MPKLRIFVVLCIFLFVSVLSSAQTADLQITMSVNDATPNEGQSIQYTFQVKNLGPNTATGVFISDLLPNGVTHSSNDSGGNYNPGTDIWNIATLNSGSTAQLKITVFVNSGTNGTTITSTPTITGSNQTDPVSSNNSTTLNITVNYPDLEITKTVDNTQPLEGETIEYTIQIKHLNTTDIDATNVLVEDILSNDLTYVSDDSGGSYNNTSGVWNVGTLTPGQTKEVNISVIVNSGTSGMSIDNIASLLSFDQNDLNATNNQDNQVINVATADLEMTKTVNDNTPDEGQAIVFTLNIKNNGPADATSLIVNDLLPAGLTYVSDDSGGTYNSATGVWTVGNLNDGGQLQIKITATVDAGTAAQTITNTASIASFDQVDDNTDDNTSSVILSVNGADLQVTKTVSDTNPAINDIITYTIVVTNNGPLKANDITIQDVLAAQLNYQSSTITQGNPYNSGTGQWFVNDLNAGASATLTLTVQVDPSANGLLIANTASVLSVIEADSITSNNSDTANIGVGSVDLGIQKTVNVATQSEGGTVVYTIQAINNSLTTDAYSTVITDLLPEDLTYVSDDSASSGTTYDSATGEWNAGTVIKNTTKILNITCTVNAGTGGLVVTNTATGTSMMEDPDTTNNSDDASFQVVGADLEVTKAVDEEFPSELDLITYTITVTNNGPINANSIVVKDLLPFNVTYDSYSASQGTYTYLTGDWNVGALNNGSSATLTITAQVRISGAFTNTATVINSSQPDGATSNNSGSVRVSAKKIFAAGSAIIDMGITPQTYNNGLIPYGLVYDLAINNNIPVYWVVNHTKSWVNPSAKQDQTDITVNSKDYKGGPFVIASEFMAAATPIINAWVTNYPGLTVDTGLPQFEAPIYDYITSFPQAVLDEDNGDKVQDAFYDRANVPLTFGRLGSPDDLTLCDDMYTMPHADPQDWSAATVNNLIAFIENGGYFWAACHAVSAMEGLVDIDSDGNPDLNMLSKNGLIEWGDHGNGTPAYSYNTDISILNGSETAGDPLMQFMSTMDGALQNGSEQIYIPDIDGWRDTTVLALTDDDHPEVIDGTYPTGPAVALAYGRAFGDDSNGLIMYEASHSIAGGSEAENTAAARVYGNFLLQAGIERRPKIKIDLLPSYNPNNKDVTFNGEVNGIAPPFTYQWSDNCGGSFNDDTLLNTTYTPDDSVDLQTCLLTLIVTDNCGRRNFTSFPVKFEIDTDDDGLSNSLDLDDDNDSIPDSIEENGDTSRDTDGDGVLDRIDLDADGDGILDIYESGLSLSQIETLDTNADGFIDNSFNFGINGIIDDLEISPDSGTVDYDGNGFQDDFLNSDSDTSYNFQDIDADNDGIPDNVEAQTTFGYVAPAATSNRFGINNSYLTNLVLADTDFDSIPDYLDTDSDNDGTPDIEENGMANTASGADTDNDGLDNNFEGGNLNDIDVNDEINVPSASILPDTDGDKAIGGDVDFRDVFNINPPSSATIDFDGIDDFMDSSLDLSGYTQVTFMAWIKLDSSFLTTGTIVDQDNFKIGVLSNLTLNFQVNDAVITLPIASALTLNQWEHIAFTYNAALLSNKLKIYLNGVLMATSNHASLNPGLYASTKKFNVGRSTADSDYFKGNIDELRVFNVALTSDQLTQTIYQEIENNSGSIGGVIVPKAAQDLTTEATIPWANLQAYYPMTDILSSRTSDFSNNDHVATLHNITTVQPQTAPMPYETGADGTWNNESTWLHGDVWDIENINTNKDWSIVKINSNISTNSSHELLGLIVESGKSLTVLADNVINNTYYLELNGTLDLLDDSQLIQSNKSDLVTSADGKILRRQEGNTNLYWYNYWSSPVGNLATTSLINNNGVTNNANNTPFRLNMLKDGAGANIQFTNAYEEIGKISTFWLYSFQNGVTYWDWSSLNTSTGVSPGVGYTQKGTGNAGAEQQYIFEGKPNNGTIILNAVDTGGPGSIENESLTTYLLGNPYPSALDARKFIDDNVGVLEGTLQLWEQWSGNSHYLREYEGGYAYINKMATSRAYQYPDITIENQIQNFGNKTPTFFIPVSQGFFAEIIGNGNIEFNNSQRIFKKENSGESTFMRFGTDPHELIHEYQNTNDYITENFEIIRLEFSSSNGANREFVLGFGEATTDQFDYGYDGGKINTMPNEDMLSVLDEQPLVLQAFSPITPFKEVDLLLNTTGEHSYSLKISELININDSQDIYLRDNQENLYWNLRNGAYIFNTIGGKDKDRFDLVFKNVTPVVEETDNTIEQEEAIQELLIYVNNDIHKLFVKGLDNDFKELFVLNAIGQIIKSFNSANINSLESGIDILGLNSGVYFINITTANNQSINKKVIIN
jgi:uncharacterized repeat protein (TIGR01451 family)